MSNEKQEAKRELQQTNRIIVPNINKRDTTKNKDDSVYLQAAIRCFNESQSVDICSRGYGGILRAFSTALTVRSLTNGKLTGTVGMFTISKPGQRDTLIPDATFTITATTPEATSK
jgi:hypothetical protein